MIPDPPSCPAYAWTLLARPPGQVCEVTITQLWGECLVFEASMSLFWFHLCLEAEAFAGTVEHDLIAQVLNEHLLEHGHRFPIPYLRPPPTSGDDPSAPRHGAEGIPPRPWPPGPARERPAAQRGHGSRSAVDAQARQDQAVPHDPGAWAATATCRPAGSARRPCRRTLAVGRRSSPAPGDQSHHGG